MASERMRLEQSESRELEKASRELLSSGDGTWGDGKMGSIGCGQDH